MWHHLPNDLLYLIYEYIPIKDRLQIYFTLKPIEERIAPLQAAIYTIPLSIYTRFIRKHASGVLNTLILYKKLSSPTIFSVNYQRSYYLPLDLTEFQSNNGDEYYIKQVFFRILRDAFTHYHNVYLIRNQGCQRKVENHILSLLVFCHLQEIKNEMCK